MYGKRLLINALFVLLLSVQAVAIANNNLANEQPDVFSHEDIRVESHQRIERLLVSGANAVVAGTITDGAIIVDGTLTLLPGAKIGGRIIILGGKLKDESGIAMEHTPWVVSPGKSPFTRIVLTAFMILFIAGIIIIPYLLWMVLHLASRSGIFMCLKKRLLNIQTRWPALYIAVALGISALMLVLFSVLAWQTIFRHATGIFDNAFIWLVRYFASPGLDRVMITITNLGFGFSYGILVLTTAAILVVFRRWIELKGLILCLLGGAALNEILKHLFERNRPEAFHLVAASGFSFPSGHAMVSLCFYGMVAFLMVRKRSWQWRITGLVITLLLIMAIGVSRIYLGVHYPSDVVAGYAAGATWLGFSISLVMWWEREGSRQKQ